MPEGRGGPNDSIVVGNVYDKYSTGNPVAVHLVGNFLDTVRRLLVPLEVDRILEAGCGEGHLAARLARWKRRPVVGIDLDPAIFERSGPDEPSRQLLAQSVYRLGFASRSFDLVVAAEVLEHLDEPLRGLDEIARVSRRYVLLSVPREPLWRVLNMARGAYWKGWGNTPGHLQHWSSAGFVSLVASRLEVVEVARPLPWTVVLARRWEDAPPNRRT